MEKPDSKPNFKIGDLIAWEEGYSAGDPYLITAIRVKGYNEGFVYDTYELYHLQTGKQYIQQTLIGKYVKVIS